MRQVNVLGTVLAFSITQGGASAEPAPLNLLSGDKKIIAERTLDLGFAFSDLIMAAAKESKLPPADYGGASSGLALEAMRANYAKEFAMQRASVKLFDSTLNVAIGAGMVMTGGLPAIVVGSSIGYVKTKAIF